LYWKVKSIKIATLEKNMGMRKQVGMMALEPSIELAPSARLVSSPKTFKSPKLETITEEEREEQLHDDEHREICRGSSTFHQVGYFLILLGLLSTLVGRLVMLFPQEISQNSVEDE